MARYRNLLVSFWTDTKVVDDFSPEDKYFYIYLMTNPHTNNAGCYELSLKQAADELGYAKETVEKLMDRMENYHKVARYSKDTKEVLIINWSKYNWSKSDDFQSGLLKEIENIKNDEFRLILQGFAKSTMTVYTPSSDGQVTDIIYNTNIEFIKEIVLYLNTVCKTNYKYNSSKTQKHINARLREGYTVEDFKKVIDKKHSEWVGTKWEQYLRPETLFGSKFEGYLNQRGTNANDGYFDFDAYLAKRGSV